MVISAAITHSNTSGINKHVGVSDRGRPLHDIWMVEPAVYFCLNKIEFNVYQLFLTN